MKAGASVDIGDLQDCRVQTKTLPTDQNLQESTALMLAAEEAGKIHFCASASGSKSFPVRAMVRS